MSIKNVSGYFNTQIIQTLNGYPSLLSTHKMLNHVDLTKDFLPLRSEAIFMFFKRLNREDVVTTLVCSSSPCHRRYGV